MANPVRPQDIIDLQGLSEDLTKLKSAFGDFDKEASAMMKTLGDRTKEYNTQLRALLATIKGTNPSESLDGQAKDFRELESALKGVKSATDALNKANDVGTKTIKELEAEKKQYIKALKQLKSETNEETEGMKALEKAIGNTSKQINTLSANYKQASKDIKVAKGSYDELQRSLTADIRALKSLEGAFTTTNGKVDINKTKVDALTKSIKQKQDALKQVDSQMGINTRNVGNYSSAMAFLVGGVRGAIGSFGTWGIAIIAVAEAMQRLNGLILMGEQLRRSQIGVENVSSSSIEASINLDFLREVAVRLGLEIEALNKDFKLFAGATEGTALEGAKTREIFDGIATAAAAMQLSVDDASGMFRAFSQMISKNTLQSEELKGQLAERLPSAIRLTAEALGITTEKLFEQMKAGKVLAADVLPLLAKKFQEVYSDDALKNAETLTGVTNQLSNAWKELLNEDTSPLRKFLIFFYGQITGILNSIRNIGTSQFDISEKTNNNKKVSQFGSLSSGEQVARLQMEQEKMRALQAKLREDEKRGAVELRKINIARLKEQTELVEKLTQIKMSEMTSDIKIAKNKNEALAKAQNEANAKALKASEKAANEALIAARKSYQVELRTLDANEKDKLFKLEKANLEGLKSDDQYAAEKLKVESEYTTQRINLAEKYHGRYKGMQEELTDDKARFHAEENQNLLNNLKLQQKIYKDYYDTIKKEFEDSFRGIGKEVESELKSAELTSVSSTNLDRIGVERERSKPRKLFGADRKESEQVGFDIQMTQIDIEETKLNLQAIGQIFAKHYSELEAEKKKALDKIDKLEGTDLEKQKSRNDIELKYEQDKNWLIETEDTKLANKQIELGNLVTKSKIENDRKEIVSAEEKRIALEEKLIGIANIAMQLEDSISQVTIAYSDRRIASYERAKEREIELAGDNKEAQIAIEREYQKKITEEKKKQDKREKISSIFQIILGTAVAVASAKTPIGKILAAASGAISLATAIATPLPEYAKGKRKGDSYEGLAIAGEKGAEIMEKDGKQTLVDKPSVVYVDPKTRIYTASETNDILRRKNNDKINSEWSYNNTYLRRTNKYERERNNNTLELSRLRRTLKDGIGQGFENASIVINNSDGSTNTHRGGNRTSDITKRAIYR